MKHKKEDGITVELVTFIEGFGRKIGVEKQTHDTMEEYNAAVSAAAKEIESLKPKKNKLLGSRDSMSAPIELAMDNAIDPNDLHSVWAALVKIAGDLDRPAPLLGITDDAMIKCQGNNKVADIFTIKQLKSRLERQKKLAQALLGRAIDNQKATN
jgi:hypothetical protein